MMKVVLSAQRMFMAGLHLLLVLTQFIKCYNELSIHISLCTSVNVSIGDI